MPFYYSGFNASMLFSNNGSITRKIDSFNEVTLPGVTDFQIGWAYFLVWKGQELYICRTREAQKKDSNSPLEIVQIPGKTLDSCEQAAIGRDNIIILSKEKEIWRYKFYEESWKRINNFITSSSGKEEEYPAKIVQGGCAVVLTNLGRVYNVPTLVDMPKRVKFMDIACGFDHTVLLAENGDVYTMGMGTRGQLGHSDLEDCDNPRLVEALAGIKVVEISADGWHSAAVTDQGDLYTWGWNTNGELGLPSQDSKVIAVPTLVDFTDERNEIMETFVKKVQCGTTFTVCITDDGVLWGCGCNKYGQLGQSTESLKNSLKFTKLTIPVGNVKIKNFKCHEWGTLLETSETCI